MSPEELRALPAIIDVETAGRVLGVGRGAAYEMVRTGTWPTPVIRLGRLIKVPTAPLMALLGQPTERSHPAGSSTGDPTALRRGSRTVAPRGRRSPCVPT